MQNKSTLMQALSNFADSRAIKIRNIEGIAAQIDKDFDLIMEGETPVVIRRATKQIVPESLDRFAAMVLRPHVDDKSFGAHRSSFKPRLTSDDERSKVQALLDHQPLHFTDTKKKADVESFIRSNFIPDGNLLRRLSNGMVSQKAYEPAELLSHYAGDVIDNERSELLQLERIADFRTKAEYLANGEKGTADRLLKTMLKINAPQFDPIPTDLMQRQAADLESKAMSHLGLLDKSTATLAEINQIAIKAKQFYSIIDELPVAPDTK